MPAARGRSRSRPATGPMMQRPEVHRAAPICASALHLLLQAVARRRGNSMRTSCWAKQATLSAEPLCDGYPGLRALIAEVPHAPLPMQVDVAAEQVMLGGRPIQDFDTKLRIDSKSWTVERMGISCPGLDTCQFARRRRVIRPVRRIPRRLTSIYRFPTCSPRG